VFTSAVQMVFSSALTLVTYFDSSLVTTSGCTFQFMAPKAVAIALPVDL